MSRIIKQENDMNRIIENQKKSGYLMVDLCLAILTLGLCLFVASSYISSISIINKRVDDVKEEYRLLRDEMDRSVSLMSKSDYNTKIDEDLITYERKGYYFKKKYTLLNEDFKAYSIDLSISDKKRTYKLRKYFVLGEN